MTFSPETGNLPLKIVHEFPNSGSMSYEEKCAEITKKLTELKEKGFGGVVTNVRHGSDYTKNNEDWSLFRFSLEEIKRLGMRAWLYDEKGYPSGGAGGMTIQANPDYESLGLVKISNVLAPGKETEIRLPKGHMYFLYAASYKCDVDGNIKSFEPIYEKRCEKSERGVTFSNKTDGYQYICAFAVKRLYEGTHAQHNVCECRRYIDVTNPDAVAEFIKNTYEKYRENTSSHVKTPEGDGLIEAIFTDEPSFMGCYINAGLYPSSVHDEYDDTIPLYPVVNFGRDVENTFESLSGLPFRKNIIYLFCGDDKKARKVRYQFHRTTSYLYEKSVFEQLSVWCGRNGFNFSGHILLEDDIRHHVIFEGNFFSLLRHMHIPGIDMLHSIPSIVREEMFTPKLVSSIAHGYNRPHVMSEVSAHAQGGNVTMDQMYASLCLQYEFGVDVFTSYYSEGMASRDDYKKYNAALGRIDKIMSGGAHRADVLLYYPIETFMMHRKPASTNAFSEFTAEENACKEGLYSIMNELADAQVDFDFADFELLKSLDIKNGKIYGKNGEIYKYLILPPMELTDDTAGFFGVLESKGVKICVMRDGCFPELNSADFGRKFSTSAALVMSFDRAEQNFAVNLDAPHRGLAFLCRGNTGNSYMFTNSNDTPMDVDLEIHGIENPMLYSPLEDARVECVFKKTSSGYTTRFGLREYETLMILDSDIQY